VIVWVCVVCLCVCVCVYVCVWMNGLLGRSAADRLKGLPIEM